MSTEGYLEYMGYRAKIERGTYVWTRILPRHYVGKNATSGKPIYLPKSGVNNVDKLRIVTNTDSYEQACQMLAAKLKDPPKEKKHTKAPGQIDLLSAIREAEKE